MKYCPLCDKQYGDEVAQCPADGATLIEVAAEKTDPFLGKLIKAKYRVIKKLGEGGMGAVYLGEQTGLGRKVALKVLHGEYARDPEFVKRFHHEARLAATVNHPNVVTTYDFDQAEDGSLFMAMEFVEGRSLRDLIQIGPMDVGEAVRYGIQIGEGLGAAHRAGIIHRDFKPENIIVLKGDQTVKLMDFGIARLKDTGGMTRLTRQGMIMGTPAYMAPEQIEGAEVTDRTDIYAFGIVMYEMLTGGVPFRASTPTAVLMKHLKEAPIAAKQLRSEIPEAIDNVVMRALEKDAQKRPKNIDEMVLGLRRAVEPEPETITIEGPPAKPLWANPIFMSIAFVFMMIAGVAVYKATTKPPAETSEQTKKAQEQSKKAQIESLLVQAKTFRDQGDYKQAYATLTKAKNIDANDDKLKAEISTTDKACNAEKALGLQKDLNCSL